jgi:hypothetical protein
MRHPSVVVVTLLTLSACGKPPPDDPVIDQPTHNPPAPGPDYRMPEGPATALQQLNPVDREGRKIYANNGSCWVNLPFDVPPTSVVPPPTKVVTCPPDMTTDPAWASCGGGELTLVTVEPLACRCFVFGNPPPPPHESPCPAEVTARIAPPAP